MRESSAPAGLPRCDVTAARRLLGPRPRGSGRERGPERGRAEATPGVGGPVSRAPRLEHSARAARPVAAGPLGPRRGSGHDADPLVIRGCSSSVRVLRAPSRPVPARRAHGRRGGPGAAGPDGRPVLFQNSPRASRGSGFALGLVLAPFRRHFQVIEPPGKPRGRAAEQRIGVSGLRRFSGRLPAG